MRTRFEGLAVFSLLFFACPVLAGTPHDGAYYFDAMTISMQEVLAENQTLINTTLEGKVKNPELLPETFDRHSYNAFQKIIGRDFEIKSLSGETDPAKIAPVLATMLRGGRITIARYQKAINTEADGSVKLKKFIPAVFGRLTVERFKEKTAVTMKQTTLGKSGFAERNPYNKPLDWEKGMLDQVMQPWWEEHKGIGEVVGKEYQYIQPIYIKKGCLVCHGVPIGEKDPYGHPKEGYEVREIRGGISVNMPLQ